MTLSSSSLVAVIVTTIQFASLVQASEFPERECCDDRSASGVLVAHLPPDLASPPAGTGGHGGHVSNSPLDINFDSGTGGGHQVDHHQPDDTSIAGGGGGRAIDIGSGNGTPMDSLDFLYPEFIPELTGSHHNHPPPGGGGAAAYPPTEPTSSTGYYFLK